MRRFREQARRRALRELDRQLQQRGPAASAVTSEAKLTEISRLLPNDGRGM